MEKSLFSNLVHYVPTGKRESKEDYLTEMFAWILKNIKGAAELYVKYLCEKVKKLSELKEDNDIAISTQAPVKNGRIDLLIKVNHKIAFICEHKVDSELSENQIKKYMDDSSFLGNEKYYSVLLTKSKTQHTQDADISIVWGNVYELFNDNLNEFDGNDKFVIEQFLKYLVEKGLGKSEMIPLSAMLGYCSGFNLKSQLGDIFKEIAKETEFQTLCPGIESLGTAYAPKYHYNRWGRIGIEMFKEPWNVGLFAGVILDTKDHKLEPMDVDKGPDFVILLESAYSSTDDSNKEIYVNNIHSDQYCTLCQRLNENHEDFDEFLPGIEDSPWRIAVLRMPLYDILYGTYKPAEQVEAIKNKMIEGINLMINAWNYKYETVDMFPRTDN